MMPDSPIIDLSHSPPRDVVDKCPQDEWNRLLLRVFIGIYERFHDAGVDDPVRHHTHTTTTTRAAPRHILRLL